MPPPTLNSEEPYFRGMVWASSIPAGNQSDPWGRFLTSPYGAVQECSASLIPTRAGWNA